MNYLAFTDFIIFTFLSPFSLGQRADLPERDEGAPRDLLLRGHQRGRPGRQEERGRRGRVQAVHHHPQEEARPGVTVRHGPGVQDRGVPAASYQMVGRVPILLGEFYLILYPSD